jgi:CheY-like chemotaxis protein
VLRRLWDDPHLRRIPVVVLSADATPNQIRRLIASGAKAYLTKPLDLSVVLSTLDRALLAPGGPRP